jgi:hypothetical protein
MFSFVWKAVIIHCHTESTLNTVIQELIAFREWENEREPQKIVLITELPVPNLPEEMCVRLQHVSDLKKVLYSSSPSKHYVAARLSSFSGETTTTQWNSSNGPV